MERFGRRLVIYGVFPDLVGDLPNGTRQQPPVPTGPLSLPILLIEVTATLGVLNLGIIKFPGDASCAASAGDPRPSRGTTTPTSP